MKLGWNEKDSVTTGWIWMDVVLAQNAPGSIEKINHLYQEDLSVVERKGEPISRRVGCLRKEAKKQKKSSKPSTATSNEDDGWKKNGSRAHHILCAFIEMIIRITTGNR